MQRKPLNRNLKAGQNRRTKSPVQAFLDCNYTSFVEANSDAGHLFCRELVQLGPQFLYFIREIFQSNRLGIRAGRTVIYVYPLHGL